VVGIFLLRVVFSLFGFVVGLFIQLLIWAAIGFGIYLVIKVLSPSTAGKIREVVTGKP
jgi:amino acid permease